MNLHLNNDAFEELVELTANYFGYAKSHIEKDYWVSKILKELTLSKFSENIYFKGGTSLSKCYGLINRFSEDLDLFIFSGNRSSSKQSEKTLNRNISHFIIENNKDIYMEVLSKTGGDFRKLVFSYDTHYESSGLKENLEVEIKCCTLEDKTMMYYPSQKREIKPVIAEYLKASNNYDLIVRFDMEEFIVQTIDPKRTLCDKIARLTRLSYDDDYQILIAKHIRDIYDIYCLLNIPDYMNFIQTEDFIEAMNQVVIEDGLYRNSQSHKSISKARVFAETEYTLKLPEIIRSYNNELKQLIFEENNLPTLDKIIMTFSLLKNPLSKFDENILNLPSVELSEIENVVNESFDFDDFIGKI